MRAITGMAAAAVLAAAAGAAGAAVAQAPPNPWWTGYVNEGKAAPLPGGRSLYVYCEGTGAPTVILDSGLGDGAASWRRVQHQMAATTRVCSYDRAGYGRSPAGPNPRDTQAEVGDLEQALKASKIAPPYVLVGHSMGSFNVRLFAYRHPRDVAGMVLVDPSADNQMAALTAAAPSTVKLQEAQTANLKACLAPDPSPEVLKRCASPPPFDLPDDLKDKDLGPSGPARVATVVAEMDAFNTLDSPETVAARRSLGAMPLIVLTAADTTKSPGAPEAEIAEASRVWSRLHDDIAALSTRGVNRLVEGSGHYIHNQKPQVVVDAVAEVVAAARARR